ncbi:DUF4337 domain-containing protein [Nostoc sp. NMS4]|uniref:DUF4337 domain-containing protein n=1 Tax=Nostoc sp. NMS4 TaxID=2815390 RepID=UPI0025F7DBC7|nr:DUF4337 domain-containing protein [Nostoc sp. NMS4]MBN3922643.1 DUF4337 domain-containing protein [Nostoc sp. NMS4]
MDINPLDLVEDEKDEVETSLKREKRKGRVNSAVAIAVALIATFMGICKVKDDNLVQAMQQAQANKIDDWALYQARNIREEIARANLTQLKLQSVSQSSAVRAEYEKQIAAYQVIVDKEDQKKQEQKLVAEKDQITYDQLNYHDDQFDLADAFLSLSVSLFAITSLSQKKWLFYAALLPTIFGLVMGLSGLLNWQLHPDALTKLLSENFLEKPVGKKIVSIGTMLPDFASSPDK